MRKRPQQRSRQRPTASSTDSTRCNAPITAVAISVLSVEGLIDRNIQGKSVWAPWYTLHKIVQGLIDQYNLCANDTALAVAKRMGDWAYDKLKPLSEETRLRMLRNEFGGFNDVMYQLYGITHDDRYLWLARFFYDNNKIDPLKNGNDNLGTNHANTFIPKPYWRSPEL